MSDQKPSRWHTLETWQWGLIFGCVLATTLVTFMIGRGIFSTGNQPTNQIVTNPTASPTPTPTPDPLRPRTFLLLGYVGGTHDGGSLTDTIMVAQVDPRLQQINLISLPRDLWVSIPLEKSQPRQGKINTAFAIGNDRRNYAQRDQQYTGDEPGLALSKTVVSEVTGLPIDYAISISMQGFLNAVNSLGPLSVDVPAAFIDEFYPILGKETDPCGYTETDIATISAAFTGFDLEKQFPCRYETLEFSRGETTMDGETALKFVRSRHAASGGGDFGRTQRQQAVITAIKEKLTTPSAWQNILPTLTNLYKAVGTDISLSDVAVLVKLGISPQQFTISSITLDRSNVLQEGRSTDGQYVLLAKNPSLSTSSAQLLTPTATSSSRATPSPITTTNEFSWQVVHEFLQARLASPAATLQP